MKILKTNHYLLTIILPLFLNSVGRAHEEESDKSSERSISKDSQMSDHHAFSHPFLAHMGMPDGPGEISTRINSFQRRTDGQVVGTYGYHIEAGMFDNLGLHLRNDGFANHPNSELMLQYALFRSDSKVSGISTIAELEYPTGATKETAKGLLGISFAYLLIPVVAINSTIHYSPREQMTDWEIAFVTNLTDKIFPVFEANGEVQKSGDSTANFLAGLKFKIANGHALGVAYEVGTTANRDFDSQLLLQAELNF